MVMIDTKAIGKRIQALRRAAGMTQEQAAETLGISPNYVFFSTHSPHTTVMNMVMSISGRVLPSTKSMFIKMR